MLSSDGVAEASTAAAPLNLGPRHGQVACVIDEAFLLLERGVVLLVHHDQAKLSIGQEQRRTRADHDPAIPRSHPVPDLTPQRPRDAGVPFGGQSAEPLPEPRDDRLGEGDLGQQDQDLALGVGSQHLGDGFQIDLGLARACHPVEQGDLETLTHHPLQHIGGGGLAGAKGCTGQGRIGDAVGWRGGNLDGR